MGFVGSVPPQTVLDGHPAAVTDNDAVDDAQEYNVQPRLEEPLRDGLAHAAAQPADFLRAPNELQRPRRDLTRDSIRDLTVRVPSPRDVRVTDKIHRQHEEREAEAVVGAGLGRDDVAQRLGDELLRKGALCDGLRD